MPYISSFVLLAIQSKLHNFCIFFSLDSSEGQFSMSDDETNHIPLERENEMNRLDTVGTENNWELSGPKTRLPKQPEAQNHMGSHLRKMGSLS